MKDKNLVSEKDLYPAREPLSIYEEIAMVKDCMITDEKMRWEARKKLDKIINSLPKTNLTDSLVSRNSQ